MEFLEAALMLGLATSGKPVLSEMQYFDMVEHGLPLRSLERIAGAVAPYDKNFKYRIVPKATLARHKQARRLSAAHSAVVSRLAAIWTETRRIWKSDDAARDFLARPHPLLENRRPLDVVLENEVGGALVTGLLGRLENGSAV